MRSFALRFFVALSIVGLSSCGGDGSTDPITETPVAVASVTLTPATPSVVAGQTVQLTATPKDAAGNTLSRIVAWTSASTSVATVNSSGLVTGVAAGSSEISAMAEGKTGTVTVTVTAPLPANLEKVSGDNQLGLTGRAHADSITVRLKNAAGVPVSGATVTWSASAGTLSAASTPTDATGVARVRWVAAAGDQTLTATVSGETPVAFKGNGRASGTCALATIAATQRFSLGPTDYTQSLNSIAALKAAVIYVDFPDAPATEDAATLASTIVDPGIAVLEEFSYGKVNMTTQVFPTWYRMSKPITQYDWTQFATHKAYIEEAMTLADAAVDFSQFDAVFIFTPVSNSKTVSPTFNGGTAFGFGITKDGKVIGHGITYGKDSRTYGATVTAHEAGHMMGLVDLYTFDSSGSPYTGNSFRYVGAWTNMSNIFNPAHLLMWEKRKLQWIDAAQWDCLESAGGEEVVIEPNAATTGGFKMTAVKLDASRALVVEVRNNVGIDANLCAAGVLIYEVNAALSSGYGPAAIKHSRVTTSGAAYTKCGPWPDAVYGVGAGAVSSYTDTATGTTVTVLAAESGGAYRVRVKRP